MPCTPRMVMFVAFTFFLVSTVSLGYQPTITFIRTNGKTTLSGHNVDLSRIHCTGHRYTANSSFDCIRSCLMEQQQTQTSCQIFITNVSSLTAGCELCEICGTSLSNNLNINALGLISSVYNIKESSK